MSVISIINNYLEYIIKKINKIEDLPSSEELKNKIDEIDNKIKNMISQNKEFNEIDSLKCFFFK